MISLKKALFALSFGVGIAASMNAWALPSCQTCKDWEAACAAGDTNACTLATNYRCAGLYPQEFCDEV